LYSIGTSVEKLPSNSDSLQLNTSLNLFAICCASSKQTPVYQYEPTLSNSGSDGSKFVCITNNFEPLTNSICLSSLILSLYDLSSNHNLFITLKNVANVVAFKSAN